MQEAPTSNFPEGCYEPNVRPVRAAALLPKELREFLVCGASDVVTEEDENCPSMLLKASRLSALLGRE